MTKVSVRPPGIPRPEPLTPAAEAPGEADDRTIYQRIVAIIAELPAIGKDQRNAQQNFMFRGHDDVMNALNPLLAKHGVFVAPHVLARKTGARSTSGGKTMYEVNLHVQFTFYGAGGDSFTASGWGEGTDMGDKSTSKAMTMAFKYVIAETFALATAEVSDADATSPEETTRETGRGGQTRSDAPRAFDPGQDLLDGAIAVRTAEDARALRAAEAEILGTANPLDAVEDLVCQHVFGKSVNELNRAQTIEFWHRLANAVVKADAGGFPPPSLEQVAEAYAWAFNGIALALAPPATPTPKEANDAPDETEQTAA